MRSFLNKAILILLLTSNMAFAESVKPHELVSPNKVAENMVEPQAEPEVGYEEKPSPAISVGNVDKPSLDGFGLIDNKNGGFPETIWSGSSKSTSEVLLQSLKTGVANDTIRSLLTQLLITKANAPEGLSENDWFSVRVATLINIGEDDKASQMLAIIPQSLKNQPAAQLEVQLKLLRGEYDSVCTQPKFDISALNNNDALFWQKINIICQIKAGKQDEAMVGLDVLHEAHQAEDSFFQDEIRKIADKNFPTKRTPNRLSLLDVSVLRLAGDIERFKDKLDSFPPVAFKYLATDAGFDIKLKERFENKAISIGVLPTKEGNKTPEQPFAKNIASDITTLVTAFGSGNPINESDNAVIARIAIDDISISDSRRLQRLLTLMQEFGYKVPTSVWEKLFAKKNRFDGEVPPAFLVEKLNDATIANKKADVIILTALIAGAEDVDKIGDLALLPIVKSLKIAGFEKEAHLIAYNAIKAYK